jgi:tRNA threonylcarbamoyladenosine biosynthesis protein TsaB
MKDIDAIAVAIGPGSYTGLRVGLASAKGFCYALQKPLIAVNTLEIIALDVIENIKKQSLDVEKIVFCPMIDARRMEVFTAVYDCSLNPIIRPTAKILDERSFLDILEKYPMVFSGTGMDKFKNICNHPNAIFVKADERAKSMATLAFRAYQFKDFANVAYIEPFYAKAFHSTQLVKNLK